MAVSLDGVMAPMQDGQRHAKRTQARAQGKAPSGPAGYQEVGGATVSYYDRLASVCAPVAWPVCLRPIKPPSRVS